MPVYVKAAPDRKGLFVFWEVEMLIVKVCEGATASEAQPIVVTSDPDCVAAVGRVLAERLGVELPRVIRRGPEAG